MIGWKPGRQEPRRPIRADFLNGTAQQTAAHSRMSVGGSASLTSLFGTPVISFIVSRFIVPAKTTEGAIAALSGTTPGVEDVSLCTWDGTAFGVGSRLVPARNIYPSAIPADRLCWLVRWGNSYWVLTVAPITTLTSSGSSWQQQR